MSQSTPSSFNIALKWGVIGTFLSIIFSMAMYLADFESQAVNLIVGLGIVIFALYMSIKSYKDETGGFATFGQSFLTGFLTSLVIAVLSAVWIYLFFEVVAPDAKAKILETAQENMAERGMDDDQIETAMEQAKFFFSTAWFSTVAVIWNLLQGTILALILAGIMKNEDPQQGREILD